MEILLGVALTTKRAFLCHTSRCHLFGHFQISGPSSNSSSRAGSEKVGTLGCFFSCRESWSIISPKWLSHQSAKRRNADTWARGAFVYRLSNCMAVIQLIPWSFIITSLFTSHSAPCLSNKLRHSENRKGEAKGCFMTIINVVKGS